MDAPEVRGDLGPGQVPAVWLEPAGSVAWLVVAHGAGAGRDHPFLVGFCRAMADHGVATARFDFRYMAAGRRSPDPEPVLRTTWETVFGAVEAMAAGLPVLAGGKSLGGRIASMCVADGLPAAGLVFLGYPLHPPGRTERLRAEHLARIGVPMLFLQGTRDPFARSDLLAQVLDGLGDRAELVAVEGGDHSFNVRGAKLGARETGAGLADHAGPFVRRVAGG